MKSPFTGGEVILQKETREMNFRKEPFTMLFHYYLCKDSGEQFTNGELDDVNTNQVYNQYRAKYGVPFPDEIRAIREQYGLSANKMSEILGFGINVYRNYESGEVPSVSNGRLIQLVKDPKEFRQLIDCARNEFSNEELEKINKKINHAVHLRSNQDETYASFVFGEKRPSIFNGYKIPNLEKINNMVLYFAGLVKPFKTKMNKLLFYADFLHFKKTCFSISGLSYQAIQKGPVPRNYDWIFDDTMQKKMVSVNLIDFGDYMGEQFFATGASVFNPELFTESELRIMKLVSDAFKNDTVNQIVAKSHKEDAWCENIDSMDIIRYDYGFNLKYPAVK